MGLSVFQRLAGTIIPHFKIGKIGPTIRQGTDNPLVGNIAGDNGDVYIRHGSKPGLFQMFNGLWREMGAIPLSRTEVNTAIFNATNQHSYLGVNFNGSVDIYLPPGSESKSFVIKDEGAKAAINRPITIHASNGQSIEGQSTYVIQSARGSITIVYGSEWHLI